MNIKTIGALTIGQSPRTDVLPEMASVWGEAVDVLEYGALDCLTPDGISALAPAAGDTVLVSRLRDGNWVRLAEQKLLPLLQRGIDTLAGRGAELIILLCTGPFPEGFSSPVPLLYPQKLLYAAASALSAKGFLGVVSPDPAQCGALGARWKLAVPHVVTASFNPYDTAASMDDAARTIREGGADLAVLDCIGYTGAMKAAFAQKTGLPVLLPRTVTARFAMELL